MLSSIADHTCSSEIRSVPIPMSTELTSILILNQIQRKDDEETKNTCRANPVLKTAKNTE